MRKNMRLAVPVGGAVTAFLLGLLSMANDNNPYLFYAAVAVVVLVFVYLLYDAAR